MRNPAFLPHLRSLKLENVSIVDQHITLVASTTRKRTQCPLCHHWSKHVHSRYWRTLKDMPWSGQPVSMHLHTRRFLCRNQCCSRRIFTERLPTLVETHGRMARPLCAALGRIGLALGARAGARLAEPLGMPVSPRTLLRVLHALPELEVPTPRVLGIDDWSRKKGQHFGSLLVDLETRQPVDVLPDRSAAVVATWLRAHPGVEIVARDRNGSYAEGVRSGAPEAVHVADRFHLMKNLVEALERLLLNHSHAREQAARALLPLSIIRPLTLKEQETEERSRRKHAPKVTAYERLWALRAQGYDIAHSARTVGISRQTAYRYLSLTHPPERKHPGPRSRSQLLPYLPYLELRWSEGCHNANQLWREICAMGYAQSPRTLARLAVQWRRQHPDGRMPSPRHRRKVWTARSVAFLFIAPRADLTIEQRTYLSALCNEQPGLTSAYDLAQDFAVLLRERQGERLDAWIDIAVGSDHSTLRNFAKSVLSDKRAVEAGLTFSWSTGPVEGHIHRLKLIKRSMYGRAGFKLLRRRVLAA